MGKLCVECAIGRLQGKANIFTLNTMFELPHQLVKAQQDRDTKIAKLVQTMQSIYSTVVGAQNLTKDTRLQIVLDLILKQTVVCGFFIQNYMASRTSAGQYHKEEGEALSNRLTGRAIRGIFPGVDGLIARYQEALEQLQNDFMGRLAMQTALVMDDIATTMHDMSTFYSPNAVAPHTFNQRARRI